MSYTKLFSSIVTSTIWTESPETCKVWVTLLALADKHGEVHASIPGLAQITGIPIHLVQSAIERFLSPDPYSRTPDDEGRRIERIDGGWALLNHAKYRSMASKDEQKQAAAERQKRFRDKKARNAKVTHSNATVTEHNATVTQDRDIAEAEADTEAKEEMKMKSATALSSPSPPSFKDVLRFAKSQPMPISEECYEAFFDEMEALQWTYKGMPCVVQNAWQARFRRYATNWANNANRKPITK